MWGKGEIARCEQFLIFPQCFQKACFPGASKGVVVWEWVKVISWQSVTLVLTQLFFPKPLTTFLTCFCRNHLVLPMIFAITVLSYLRNKMVFCNLNLCMFLTYCQNASNEDTSTRHFNFWRL